MEERLKDLVAKLEGLSSCEKHFVLWLLLREYSEENEKEIPERSDTIEDFRKEKFYHGLCSECNDLIDVLDFELWR